MRRGGIVGQALGQRDADRHFDVAGQAAQDFAHQLAFALVQTGALDAIERGDGEIDFLAAVVPCGLIASWASLPMSLMSCAVKPTACPIASAPKRPVLERTVCVTK